MKEKARKGDTDFSEETFFTSVLVLIPRLLTSFLYQINTLHSARRTPRFPPDPMHVDSSVFQSADRKDFLIRGTKSASVFVSSQATSTSQAGVNSYILTRNESSRFSEDSSLLSTLF